MDCQEIQPLIPEYLNEELAAEETAQIRTHLASCPHCRQGCMAFEKTWAVLDQWEDIEPEPGYVSRFWTRLSRERPVHQQFGMFFKGLFLNKRLVPVYVTLAVVIVVGFLTLKTSLTIHLAAENFASLPAEDIEFIESMDLAENLELLEDMDFLDDIEVIEQLGSAGDVYRIA